MKTKIKLRKEQNEKLKREVEANDIIKEPINAILYISLTLCSVFYLAAIVMFWRINLFSTITLVSQILATVYVVALPLYLAFKFGFNKKLKWLEVIIYILIMANMLLFAYYSLFNYEKNIQIIFIIILLLLCSLVGYYLLAYIKVLSNSSELSTTINLGNILLSVVILILTFIQLFK